MKPQPQPDERAVASSTGASPSRQAEQRLGALNSLLEGLEESGLSPAAAAPRIVESHENRLAQVRLGMASSLYTALRAKHPPTASHSLRVAIGCSSWALALELDDHQRDELEVAALLHDIGKIGVPDQVLQKPRALTSEEALVMERQRQTGLQILRNCCASESICDIVHYAPAWYDGGREGFDRQGEELPLGARMVAVVDAFDAMTTDHVYRPAMSQERALAELYQFAGRQFDGKLVDHFCRMYLTDQSRLHAEVTRRWLRDLDSEAANAHWRLQAAPKSVSPTIDTLFHRKLLENMHDAVVFVDSAMRIVHWNRAAERLTGISAESVYDQRWVPNLVNMYDEHRRLLPDEECPLEYAITSGVQSLRRLTIRRRNGQLVVVDAHAIPVIGNDGARFGATLILHDASSETKLEERVQTLHERATKDPLTQVANRAEFDRTHDEMVAESLSRNTPCSLIICDLDFFKRINDTYGHQAGDQALVTFAALLKNSCRPGDLVARYGGEEFVVLCPDCDNHSATSRAEEMRQRLACTSMPSLNGQSITASFGVTEVQAGDTPETMLRRSDRALLQAKDMGRNTVVQLGAGMNVQEPSVVRRWWSWFLPATPQGALLQRRLVTSVSMSVTAQKLRGFVADHHAEVMSIDNNHVVLRIAGQNTPLVRRYSDRAVAFVIDLSFEEVRDQRVTSSGQGLRENLRTRIIVSIQPRRSRDRRRRDALQRARQLLMSLKSYLMAHEETSSGIEADIPDDPPEQPDIFSEALTPSEE